MANDPFDMEHGAAQAAPDQLANIVSLAEEMAQKEAIIASMEEEIAKARKAYNYIRMNSLPEAMAAARMAEFTLEDGRKIKTKSFVSGSLPKEEEKREEALIWLEDNGASDLIKTVISVAFTPTEHNMALGLAAELRERKLPVKEDEGVNTMTLQAFARERLRNGEPLPLELLGLYSGTVAEFVTKSLRKKNTRTAETDND